VAEPPTWVLPTYALDVDGAQAFVRDAAVGESLLEVLRGRLGVTAVKDGCADGSCGACTVLLDAEPYHACLLPAVTASGRRVLTAAGIGGGAPTDVTAAFEAAGAVQCGFCVPAAVLAAHALLAREPDPGDATVREALSGVRCRCGGHNRMVQAVLATARARAERRSGA
jgi:carbon-monoxide dehydrogenase small subunit